MSELCCNSERRLLSRTKIEPIPPPARALSESLLRSRPGFGIGRVQMDRQIGVTEDVLGPVSREESTFNPQITSSTGQRPLGAAPSFSSPNRLFAVRCFRLDPPSAVG